ncbi:prominin-like protein [Drosophila obscura]|uniref:prominin-like protein n=1 Tax=Drosophila obscura TaxID=7282 RepID=UPI001BB295FE|nr:prominin-like protein [Drosophila obscura]
MYSSGYGRDHCRGCHCLVCECIGKSTGRRRRRQLAATLPARRFHAVKVILVLIPIILIVLARAAGGAKTVKSKEAPRIKSAGAKILKTNAASTTAPAVGASNVKADEQLGQKLWPAEDNSHFMGYPPYSQDPFIFRENPNGKANAADNNYGGFPSYSRDPLFFARADRATNRIVKADDDGPTTASDDGGGATTMSSESLDVIWRVGYLGDGTTHEQLGQRHWPTVEYTKYVNYAPYSRDLASTSKALNPVYDFTHFILDLAITEEPALPPGYVVATSEGQLVLGPKVHQNDWAALLDRYWFLLLFVIFLLAWIIVIPFVGVCYCCLCCCLRCKQGCLQCTGRKDFRWRICCGVCLFLIILGLIFGLVTAFVANKFMDRGFGEAKVTMRRGNDDTCVFLNDVAEHIHHLMVYNYQELEAHFDEHLNNAHDHIFLDLADTSEGNSLTELERILDNMPKAYQLMKQVNLLEKEIRLLGSQLRDGLRGIKRTVSYAASWLCPYTHCYKFHHDNRIALIDTSSCLHFDLIPNSTVYLEAIEKIIKNGYHAIPKRAIVRLNEVKVMIGKQMKLVIPPMLKSIDNGRLMYLEKATEIRDIIEDVISDIHLNTLSSTKTFDDVYEMFGPDRSALNQIIITLIFIIIVILSLALICGCVGSARRAPGRSGFCSKGMAASCMLIAIILIFCVFSFIALVGLFYLMIGIVTHETACATSHGGDDAVIFRQLDSLIDINRLMAQNRHGDGTLSSRTLAVKNSIKACQANESIFELLIRRNVFNINDLRNREILVTDDEDTPLFAEDLSQVKLLTDEEKIKLNEMREGNLSQYHSILYKQHLCTKFVHMDMSVLAEKLHDMSNFLSANENRPASISFKLDYTNTRLYFEQMHEPLRRSVHKILDKLRLIDSLILHNNNDFNTSISLLMEAAEKSEKFVREMGRNFINKLAKNLTATTNEVIAEYVERVILESKKNVGHCQPLAYIYYQGAHFVCTRLVDPINAFWVAIILCALLLLPALYVCHRLMCLYLKVYPIIAVAGAAGAVARGGCPFCTGKPAPIRICVDGQQAYCECPFGARTDQAAQQSEHQVQWADTNPVTGGKRQKND